jgi:two-component system, chemotaxis family, sensor kinase CheA
MNPLPGQDDAQEELNLYLNESREHLSSIETDLLKVEADGANIDEKLVNKVFRAAHSIKGGAGFFGLSKIQELAHRIENILDMVRSREIIPNPEVINILLMGFDRLRELIYNPQESHKSDNQELIESLNALTTAYLPENQKGSLLKQIGLTPHSGGPLIHVTEFDLSRAEKHDEYVYLVEIDLIHDVQRLGKTPWEVFKDLQATGEIIECAFNFAAVGTLDDEVSNCVPLEILFATIIDPSFINMLFEGVTKEHIRLIQGPKNPQPMLKPTIQGVTMPAPAVEPAAAAPQPKEEIKPAQPVVEAPQARSVSAAQPAASANEAPREAPKETAEDTLRVNVGLLENLMNLAGELVLGRNQLQEAIRAGNQHDIRASGQRINLVTTELQETIMLTRMQPVGNILNKFPRVVRDLSRELNKDIQLELIGKEVELDKTIIEGLSEPLTHMVRNAVDHGIESPAVRRAKGKPASGKITLKAYYTAGQVVVEISDDGQGLDAQKISTSAVRNGRISAEQARMMSDQEKMALIFLPGVSTAEKVTDISGRGVGMDVVKTNLDKLGGKVEIESAVGQGTTFRITLPLTLAIIPSLLVSVNKERFAIPQINIRELVHVPADQAKSRIEVVGSAEVLLLRGKLVPLVRLTDLLDMDRVYIDEDNGQDMLDRRMRLSDRRSRRQNYFDHQAERGAANPANIISRGTDRRHSPNSDLEIVVINAGIFEYGLVVDQLHDTVEIVVRPLGRHLKQCREYGGATVLGDGHVALILDTSGLATKASLNSLSGTTRSRQLKQETERAENMHALLLFYNAPDEPCAIPLDQVARVERIERRQVENLGGKRTMQYRESTLPLVQLSDSSRVGDISPDSELAVIVLNTGDREIGLLAAMPVDAIETDLTADTTTLRQTGIAGSAILNGQTTLLVDIHEVIEAAGWSMPHAEPEVVHTNQETTILLVEDSDFFRTQVRRYLEGEGYKVIAAEDGQAGWDTLKSTEEKISLVVTDVEMPRMDGLELTRHIRADLEFKHLPVVALTSLAAEEEIERGKNSGVTAYEIKLDKDRLLESVRQLLAPLAV